MKTNITEISRMGGSLRWKSPVFIIFFVLLFCFFIIDSILDGEGIGDVVLCFGPLFSGLKDKLTKGLNKLNEKLDQLDEDEEEEEDDDEDDDEDEEDEDEEDEEEEDDEEEEEEDEDEDEDEDEEEDIEEVWKKRIAAKYARGEELTKKEKFALELLMENEEIRIEQKRREAEYDAQIAAQKEAKKAQRKEMFSKIGGVISSVVSNNSSTSSSASTNPQRNSTPQKTVRKVWTMRYIGQGRSDAPKYLQVPSVQQYGRPSRDEIIDALMAIGYDKSTATGVANGGSTSTWEVVG